MKTSGRLLVAALLLAFTTVPVLSAVSVWVTGTGKDLEGARNHAAEHAVGLHLLKMNPSCFQRNMDALPALVAQHRAEWVADIRVLSEVKRTGEVEIYAEVSLNDESMIRLLSGEAESQAPPAPSPQNSSKAIVHYSLEDAGSPWFDALLGFVDRRVITRQEILGSGARNLGDLLRWLPGIRIAMGRSQSLPSFGPLTSSGQFSRVLLMMNGHRLNKSWNGGADQEWGTGFLEGLREVVVYTGPQTVMLGSGAFDLAVDLITVNSNILHGRTEVAATFRADSDRFGGEGLHMAIADSLESDITYSLIGDFAHWNGRDIPQDGSWFIRGDRMEKTGPNWQVFTSLVKGPWSFSARYLQNHQEDPHNCNHNWNYFYAEVTRRFSLPGFWNLRINAQVDNIDTRWGDFRLFGKDVLRPRQSVLERREGLKMELERMTEETVIRVVGEFRNDEVNEGPSVAANDTGFMEFDTQSGTGSLTAAVARKLSLRFSAMGAIRAEKSGYYDWAILPEAALQYAWSGSSLTLRYSEGQRYQDTWWRIGSGNLNAWTTSAYAPYVFPVKLDPERNRELRLWGKFQITDAWSLHSALRWGQFRHLQGTDWDFVLSKNYTGIRITDLGGYSYWGAEGSLYFNGKNLKAEANLGWTRPHDLDLRERELFVDPSSRKPLYLPSLTANFLLDWIPRENISVSGRLNVTGGTRNGGIDYASPGLPAVFDTGDLARTGTAALMNLSLRFRDLGWRRTELQFSFDNLFNQKQKFPVVEGGTYTSPGFQFGITMRKTF